MICNCGCHLTLGSACCPFCAESVASTPPQLEPHHLGILNAQINMEANDGDKTFHVGLILTPPNGFGGFGLSAMQYGASAVVTQEILALDYMGGMQLVHQQLCAQMTKYFNESAWPSWVLDVVTSPAPMVASNVTLAPQLFYPGPPSPLKSDYVSGRQVVDDLSFLLPGLAEIVPCPAVATFCNACRGKPMPMYAHAVVDCGHPDKTRCVEKSSVQHMIVHLNDRHRWSREVEIADWLESLDVDLEFPSEEEIARRKEEHEKKRESIAAQMMVAASDYKPSMSTVNKLIQDIYAPVISQMKEDMVATASWYQKKPDDPWEKKAVTFEVKNKIAAMKEIVEKIGAGSIYLDNMQLEAPAQIAVHPALYDSLKNANWYGVPVVPIQGEWLDNVAHTVDPLEFKKNQAKHYQQFTHNPTKSKPPKKK